MISTNTSRTNKIEVMQTLSSFLSKACTSGQEARTAPKNQLLWTRIAKSIGRLAIALVLLSPLAIVNLSYAAGRIIFDDFESYSTGTLPTTIWAQFDARPLPMVVTSSADGILGPYAGAKMLRSDSTSSNNGQTAYLDTSNYTNELFIRARVRIDNNHQITGTSPRKLLRFYTNSDGSNLLRDLFGGLGNYDGATGIQNAGLWSESGFGGDPGIPTYWGNLDQTYVRTSWHKIEYYINQSQSRIKVWHDGILIRNNTVNGNGVGFGAPKWKDFYLVSNWEDSHSAGNYLYFDNFEVFSDNGIGASGQMSDATISSGSGGQTIPNAPSNPQVTAN